MFGVVLIHLFAKNVLKDTGNIIFQQETVQLLVVKNAQIIAKEVVKVLVQYAIMDTD